MITRRALGRAGLASLLVRCSAEPAAAGLRLRSPKHPRPGHPPVERAALRTVDAPALLDQQIDLAAELLKQSGAAAVSPMSLVGALAVVGLGCDAPMRAAMEHALRFPAPLSPDALTGMLAAFVAIGDVKKKDVSFPLTLASRLLIDPVSAPVPALLTGLQGYGVDVSETNLSDPKAVADINAWVRRKTDDLIPSIIDAPPGRGGLVSLNALHFKDRWQDPFDPTDTGFLPFHSRDGRRNAVRMMRKDGRFSFARRDGFAAVDLAFGTARFALALVTRTDAPADSAQLFGAGKGWLAGRGFDPAPGAITIPRFRLSASADLLGPLRRLGFQPGPLTFFGASPPSITSIRQHTLLAVTEEGAEAAAATAVAATRSLEGGYLKLVIDKPFVFALRDKSTGFVPIAGFVGRPDTLG